MAFRDILVAILEDDGVGTYGVTIFVGTRSAAPPVPLPSGTLTIIETGGTGAERTHNDDVGPPATIRPGAQLTARAADYATAESLGRAAYNSLVRRQNQTIAGAWVKDIIALQEPFDGGINGRGESQIIFNVVGKIGSRTF